MKDKILKLVGDKLNGLNLWIDDVYTDKEDGNTFLHIVLDSERVLNIGDVTMATRIINPLLDEIDVIDESYILDVYAKEKGDDIDEQ